MKKTLNLLLSAILVVTSFVGLGNVATADGHGFPSKPIEVVTHAGLGGGTDTTARMLLIRTRKNLKNNAYITPKKGDSGNKAMAYVKSKPRDGHTVLAITPTHLFRMARGEAALTIDDFVGVARTTVDPIVIFVNAKSPYKTIEDLIICLSLPLHLNLNPTKKNNSTNKVTSATKRGIISNKISYTINNTVVIIWNIKKYIDNLHSLFT